MGISISTNEDLSVLEVTYSSDPVSSKDLAEQRSVVADEISRSNIQKILLDASALVRFPSIFTMLEHSKGIATNEILRKSRFAVVCSSLRGNERDLETTGLNRGVRIKCFISRDEALSWLTQ